MKLRVERRFKGNTYTIGTMYVNGERFVIRSKTGCATLRAER